MGRARSEARVQAMKRGGDRAGRRERGKLRLIVDVYWSERLGRDVLVLSCGHETRPPFGMFGRDLDWRQTGQRRECLECARALTSSEPAPAGRSRPQDVG